MSEATREKLARIPADATPEILRAALGEPQTSRQPDPDESTRLEAFGVAAAELMRINIELYDAEHRYFWNADDVLTGALEADATAAGLMPEAAAHNLGLALSRLLDAAEAASRVHLFHMQTSRPPAGSDRVILEWLSDGPEAAVSELSLDLSEETLVNQASAAYRRHAAAIAAALGVVNAALDSSGVRGRVQLQTFGQD